MKRKAYVVVAYRKDGSIVGFTERGARHGLNSNKTRLYRPSKRAMEYIAGDLLRLCKRYSTSHTRLKFYRVGSKHCPIKLDWKRFKTDSDWKHIPFTIK